MQVYKIFLKVVKSRIGSMMIYFGIFIVLIMIMSNQTPVTESFSEEKLDIAVIDLDKTEASKEFTAFIKSKHNIEKIKTDEDSISDALFYREIDSCITIKEGFSDNIENGQLNGLFTLRNNPDTYNASFFEGQVDQFISAVNMYHVTGENAAESIRKAANASKESTEVTVASTENKNTATAVSLFSNFMAYILPSMIILGIAPILVRFNEKDTKNRINCSATVNSSITFQKILGAFTVTAIIWAAFILIQALMYSEQFLTSSGAYSILNSLVLALLSAAITTLVASFNVKDQTVSMIQNILTLGMSFLCGVFVPQSLLGSGVLSASRFLPVYWYIKANNMIWNYDGQTFSSSSIIKCIGIEFIFTAVIFIIVIFRSKNKAKSE